MKFELTDRSACTDCGGPLTSPLEECGLCVLCQDAETNPQIELAGDDLPGPVLGGEG